LAEVLANSEAALAVSTASPIRRGAAFAFAIRQPAHDRAGDQWAGGSCVWIDDDSVDRLANSVASLTTAPQLPETMTPTRATQRLIDTRVAIGNRRSILRQSNRMG
jgi:hypothetical protein